MGPSPAEALMDAGVRQLVATHADSAGRRMFEFAMYTACYRADALT